jgi:hypothetical protein
MGKKFCSQSSAYFSRHVGLDREAGSAEGHRERPSARKKISETGFSCMKDRHPGLQLLTEEDISAVILNLFIFIGTTYITKFSICIISKFVVYLLH